MGFPSSGIAALLLKAAAAVLGGLGRCQPLDKFKISDF
jgi:hypothetical protein